MKNVQTNEECLAIYRKNVGIIHEINIKKTVFQTCPNHVQKESKPRVWQSYHTTPPHVEVDFLIKLFNIDLLAFYNRC